MPTNVYLYLAPRPESNDLLLSNIPLLKMLPGEKLLFFDKAKLLYHINRLIGVYHLYISLFIASNILATTAHKKDHLSVISCKKIIIHFWFISDLTKLLRSFIYHCPQCLVLQIKRNLPYGFLQFIDLPFIAFFILMFNFILVLLTSKKRQNTLKSVT